MIRRVLLRGAARTNELRLATYEGTEHLVVPVVALLGDAVVRPLNSTGPEFVPAEELAACPGGWNGRPVVPDHPHEGTATANDPRTLEALKFGEVFGAEYRGGALRLDAYLHPGRAVQAGPGATRVLERLIDGQTVEVSVGCWVQMAERQGRTPRGEEYQFVWSGIVPDHLAMLPEGTEGACSVEMGCGALRNDPSEDDMNDPIERFAKAFRDLLGGAKADEAEASKEDQKAEPATDAGASATPTLAAACGCNTGHTAHDQGAQMKTTEKLVGRLIANARSPFAEDDRATLAALSEEALEDLDARYSEEDANEEPAAAAEPATEPEAAAEPAQDPDVVHLSRAEYEDIKAAAACHKQRVAAQKAALVTKIAAAQKTYTEADLKSKDVGELEKLAALLKLDEPTPDYGPAGATLAAASSDVSRFAPPNPWARKETN